MNFVYSSDENYAQHMGVSMLSLMDTNQDVDEINFYIFDNGITDGTKEKLIGICDQYKRNIAFIDFGKKAEELTEKITCPISISTYARLFIPEMLPETCHKAIYLDCDTVVCDSLMPMWNLNLCGCSVGGVKDTLSNHAKLNIELQQDSVYVNAGVLIIDIDSWRRNNRQQQFLDFINENNGKVFYQDQGVVNAVLSGDIMVIPPKFNAMTPLLTSNYKRFTTLYHLEDYYKESEVLEANEHPSILHFTPEYVGRVWETGCKHPQKEWYIKYLDVSPWKGNIKKKTQPIIKLRLLYWMERNLPIWSLKLLKLV